MGSEQLRVGSLPKMSVSNETWLRNDKDLPFWHMTGKPEKSPEANCAHAVPQKRRVARLTRSRILLNLSVMVDGKKVTMFKKCDCTTVS
jgi:hypothetical protein